MEVFGYASVRQLKFLGAVGIYPVDFGTAVFPVILVCIFDCYVCLAASNQFRASPSGPHQVRNLPTSLDSIQRHLISVGEFGLKVVEDTSTRGKISFLAERGGKVRYFMSLVRLEKNVAYNESSVRILSIRLQNVQQ